MKDDSEKVWSPKSAATAYLDTLKLCKDDHERRHDESKPSEPESSEFISALAAGMRAQLIVEVSSEASQSTIALAAAARQTGGRLVCILPVPDNLTESKEVIKESGLKEVVEFKVGNPYELLPAYENIDFSLVDCRTESYRGLLELLDVNPRRSVVVTSNLERGREGINRCVRAVKSDGSLVRSMKHLVGSGMEVTLIGRRDEFGINSGSRENGEERKGRRRRPRKSRWVKRVDAESGEEHIFRVLL